MLQLANMNMIGFEPTIFSFKAMALTPLPETLFARGLAQLRLHKQVIANIRDSFGLAKFKVLHLKLGGRVFDVKEFITKVIWHET